MFNRKLIVLGNGTDWCEQSLCKLREYNFVKFDNRRVPINNDYLSKIARIHFSYKINNFVNIPFKSIWYSRIAKSLDIVDGAVLLIYDRNIFGADFRFLNYIRQEYDDIKIVYLFTNICKYTLANEKNYLDKLNFWYDIVFAFDPEDAKKYNFVYSPLIYDKDSKFNESKLEENLVFYVGKAKDRLSNLISCYEKLRDLGINTEFHIANVCETDIKYSNDIVYNKFMDYSECVNAIQRSTCLIDIIQGGSTGLTIKTCEAICYNKKLITTNKHIKDYPFYDSRYIRVIESLEDIDEDFFKNNKEVHYSNEGKYFFSADAFIERLEKELDRKRVKI